jgi:cell wall-associated NlpC family hydrolase
MKFTWLKRLRHQLLILIVLSSGVLITSCKTRKIITDSSRINRERVSGNLKDRYSVLLGVAKSEIGNEKLYRFIDNWIGVPHKIGGMDKKGIDCSGFTTLLKDEVYNQRLPRNARQMAESVKRIYEDELQEGDLVFFNFDGQEFSHVGVYLHNNKFVHASTSKGVIISDLKDSWYYKYFSRAGQTKTAAR